MIRESNYVHLKIHVMFIYIYIAIGFFDDITGQ